MIPSVTARSIPHPTGRSNGASDSRTCMGVTRETIDGTRIPRKYGRWAFRDRWRRYNKVNRVVGRCVGRIVRHKGPSLLASFLRRRPATPIDLDADVELWRSIRCAFEELGPTFVKFGQILSTLSDGLPKGLQEEFTNLQEKVDYLPTETVVGVIEAELGASIEATFAHFDPTPLAGASIGQAHRAVLPSGESVVVKVMRPNIADIVEYDLKALLLFARILERFTPFGRYIHFVDRVELLRTSLQNEMDYRKEAENLTYFNALFADDPNVRYPKVFSDYSTSRILTMEYIAGRKIYEVADEMTPEAKDKLARLIARHFFKQIHLYGFFHSDPHPGNIIITGPESFAVIDCGMVGRLTESFRKAFMREAIGVASNDVDAIFHAWYAMGILSPGEDITRLRPKVEQLLDSLNIMSQRSLESLDFARITKDIFKVLSQVSDSPQFLMLEKTYLTLYGVLTMLTPRINLFEISRDVALHYFENEVERLFSDQTAILSSQMVLDIKEMIFRLPKRIDNIILHIERGEQKFQVANERWSRNLEKIAHRLDQIFLLLLIFLLLVVSRWGGEAQWQIFGASVSEITRNMAIFLGGILTVKWLRT
ncbi:MAG: AarF/ABC1/UbiB kinase family protein [Deltaproteobacteria bacterium]|nr:MAG: AarF/ABC1/UbiB kinase family protein [Deltaproteobacteria bacterium]